MDAALATGSTPKKQVRQVIGNGTMKTSIAARRLALSESLKLFIEEELTALDAASSKLNTCKVILDQQHQWHEAELLVSGKHISIAAHGRAISAEAALHQALLKVRRQLDRCFSRRITRRQHATALKHLELSALAA